MAPVAQRRATLEDLYRTEGKAELIGGRIVPFMATGDMPSQVASNIYVSLREYAKKNPGKGVPYGDNTGIAVEELPSGRESFSPDVCFHTGPRPKNRLRFPRGAPIFAVEVRSENAYTASAKREMAAKRRDYFSGGTLVVWDVDTKAKCIHLYRSDKPTKPTTYRMGQVAEAEPAVLGWRMLVDEVFSLME
jgi:Uma2 family endonuclease